MRCLFGFICALALGVMGCSETSGTAGAGGDGGSGGAGGMPECVVGSDCDDGDQCTSDWCTDGMCEFRRRDDGASCSVGPHSTPWGGGLCVAGDCRVLCETPEDCGDFNECTAEMCTPFEEAAVCDFTPVADGTPCGGGTCQSGSCDLTGSVLPCTEQGIRNAIAAGGGPYTFDCDGPQSIVPETFIVIENSVVLDGEGNLTLDGDSAPDLLIVLENVSAELRRLTVTGGGKGACDELGDTCAGIANQGTLALANVTLTGNGYGVLTSGSLTVTNTSVSDNERAGIYNDGALTLENSTVSGNAEAGAGIANFGGGTVMLTACTVVDELNGAMTVANSLVAGACADAMTSDGHNIESGGDTCGFDQPTDQANVSADDLKLGDLADNGGPTETHALGDGSVAIDVIPEAECAVDTDQRGEPRDSMCDIGAFEVQQ